MTRRTPALAALVLAATLIAAASAGGIAAPMDTTATDNTWAVAGQETTTDGAENDTATETERRETEATPTDVRNLTGDNQTAILAGNESAAVEAGLANVTLPSQQNRNGTLRVDGTTGVYDYAVVTAKNGTLQLFVRNTTIATTNGTATVHNAFVAIGDNLSRPQLRVLHDALRAPFERAGVHTLANVSAVTPNETVNATTTETTTANVTNQANATVATGPQLDDLALGPFGQALATAYEDPVLDQQVRMKAGLVNVRMGERTVTYRNVLLRGTLREILTGQANTTERDVATTNDTEVMFEREYFDVTSLEAPDAMAPGQTYRINATVTNRGEESGAEEVSVKLAGEALDQQLVRLDANESTTVSFQVDPSELGLQVGTYELGVYAFANNATTIVEVRQNTTSVQ